MRLIPSAVIVLVLTCLSSVLSQSDCPFGDDDCLESDSQFVPGFPGLPPISTRPPRPPPTGSPPPSRPPRFFNALDLFDSEAEELEQGGDLELDAMIDQIAIAGGGKVEKVKVVEEQIKASDDDNDVDKTSSSSSSSSSSLEDSGIRARKRRFLPFNIMRVIRSFRRKKN